MATFVVESDYNKGGTWAGATDALKNGWGKVLVWDNGIEGNTRLVEAGAAAYEITDEKLIDTISKPQGLTKYEQLRLDIL
jgi:hypothetical protein